MKNSQILLILIFSTICAFAQQGKSDWLIEVKLHSGSSMKGVARNAVFLEKQSYGEYRVLKNQNQKIVNDLSKSKRRSIRSGKRNLGIRLWYVKNSEGHIFIPYGDVREIIVIKRGYNARKKVLAKNKQVAKDYKEVQKQREKYRELSQQKEQQRQQELEKERKLAQKKQRKKDLTLTKEEEEILEEYPPGDNWNEDAYNGFRRRLNNARNNFSRTASGGIAKNFFGGVNKKERTFVKRFDFWQATVKKQERIEEAEAKAKLLAEQKKAKQTNEDSDEDNGEEPDNEEEIAEESGSQPEDVEDTKQKPSVPNYSSSKEIKYVLYSKNPKIKMRAVERLGIMKEKKAIPALSAIIEDSKASKELKLATLKSLGQIYTNEEKIQSIFKRRLNSSSVKVRTTVLDALLATNEDLSPMRNTIQIATLDNDKNLRYKAIRIIEKQVFTESVDTLKNRLYDRSPKVKLAAVYTMLKLDKSARNKKSLKRYTKFIESLQKTAEDDEVKALAQTTLSLLK